MIIERQIPSDDLTPVAVYRALGGIGCCLIEESRTSTLGIDPVATFKAFGNSITIEKDGKVISFEQDPYVALKAFSKDHKVFGLLSYDAIRVKEKIPSRHKGSEFPDFLFRIYRTVVRFDHEKQMVHYQHEGTEEELDLIISKKRRLSAFGNLKQLAVVPDLNRRQFAELVERAKEFILAGEIFQIVLSRTFKTKISSSAFDVYRALRFTSGAPHLFFFEEKDFAVAGASPELLISVQDGIVESMPIAGTRPKGRADELLKDPKELAEHTMLVDLARNDLGSIAKPGSVRVVEFQTVRSFSHVDHIVSRVTASLRQDIHPLDALKASFPAGTLSGAPKIRAMELSRAQGS